ncbi:MAG: YdbH domain-containing protein [Alphaproteobacteria bacterium]
MLWLVVVLVLALSTALVISYLARRVLAREALIAWLNGRGVEAEASFETLGPRGLEGGLRIGPADAPILETERAVITYRFTGPWVGRGFGVEVERLELFAPMISVDWTSDGPSLGALDPLIAEFRSRPSRPDAAGPDIVVHDGLLRITHAAGQARIHADATMREGVLVALVGRLEPTHLEFDDLSLQLNGARLGLVTRDGRSSLSLAGALTSGRLGDVSVGPGALSAAVNAPYPQASTLLGQGPITAVATLKARSLSRGGDGARMLQASGSFQGRADGGLEALALRGETSLRADVEQAKVGDLRFEALTVSVQDPELTWRRGSEGAQLDAVQLALTGVGVRAGALNLTKVASKMRGSISARPGRFEAALRGPVSLSGGWTGLGPTQADDVDTLAAIKHAARAFSLTAPSVALRFGPNGLQLGLNGPMRVTSASGGRATLTAHNGEVIYADGAGAFDLKVAGGGLPELDAKVASYQLSAGEVTGQTWLSATTDFGPLEGLSASLDGRFAIGGAGASLYADTCAPVRINRFEAGETSVDDISFNLCPGAAPLLRSKGGQWAVQGRVRNASAQVPFLQAGLAKGQADLRFGSEPSGLSVQSKVTGGELVDTSEGPRFNPLEVTGTISLAANAWRGDLMLSSEGRPVGAAQLAHNGATGAGGVDVDTGTLVFEEGGLQPLDLSPLATAIGSPATGRAQFIGGFDWGRQGTQSDGRLSVLDLDFVSPAGKILGLSGDLAFTSLAPLETAPGQQLTARELELLAPLATPQVTFQLLGQSLEVAGGAVSVGGGTVRVEPMSVPFDGDQSWRGELVVEGVQLADIVQATPFADRVSLSARVSGRLPFIMGPEGFRIVQGRLGAIEPGRLSIRRAALTDVNASGGEANAAVEGLVDEAPLTPASETNTAVDFAYQAMEHLAFDLLDAEVNSLPGGRLGVLFRVRGEHSPPERQEIRLTLGELIARDFLNRELPLPSGTKVDLTLDTSLNLDQLLSDYAQAQAARGSGEVQAPEPD